ncbi:MAG: hypothetical protein ACJAQT_001214 [Akkermansiaceae bacterium]|jgi:hypothetical protein
MIASRQSSRQANSIWYSLKIVKKNFAIAGIFGLVLGFGVRELSMPYEIEKFSMDSQNTERRQGDAVTLNEFEPSQQWGLCGDLRSEELLALPPGATRYAETALWALSATPAELAELAAHWDRLAAPDSPDLREINNLNESLAWLENQSRDGRFDDLASMIAGSSATYPSQSNCRPRPLTKSEPGQASIWLLRCPSIKLQTSSRRCSRPFPTNPSSTSSAP